SDVDPQRIAFYGLGIGSAVALHTAVSEGGCRALVVEGAPSLRDTLREQHQDENAVSSTLAVGFAEFVHAPDDAEPSENAAKLRMPSLWLGGGELPRGELRALLRAFVEMGGDKQLWIMPGTGAPPHALMTQDGEYQRAIARFLGSALDGAPDRVAVAW